MLTDGFWTFSLAAFVVTNGARQENHPFGSIFGEVFFFLVSKDTELEISQSFCRPKAKKKKKKKKNFFFNNISNPESIDDCNIYWKPQASKQSTAVIYEWFHFLLLKYSIRIKHAVYFSSEKFLKGKIILVLLSKIQGFDWSMFVVEHKPNETHIM